MEYKLKLITPTPSRFTRLVTQLKYRLLEGGGQALYEIGVSDFGELVGLTRSDLNASLDTLERMAGELGATVVVLKEIQLPDSAKGARQFVVPKVQQVKLVDEKGQKKMSPEVKGKKDRDREARRNRRAAALLIGDVTSADNEKESVQEDLSQTITLARPEIVDSTSLSSSQPMPIIKQYPYGRQPFALSRAKASQSPEQAANPASSTSLSIAGTSPIPNGSVASFSSMDSTLNLAPDDFVYNASTSSDSNAMDSLDDTEGDEDPAFSFGFDLDISSFTKSMTAPSPRVKPPSKPKPLHYSSFTDGIPPPPPLLLVEDVSLSSQKRLKSPRASRKPIIPGPPPMSAEQKAAERRLKRDSKRADRTRVVNGAPAPASKRSLTPEEENSVATSPVEQDDDDDTGPKVIAEALVVRKLALDEAFLDFGGFALVDEASSSSRRLSTTSSDGGGETPTSDDDSP